MDEDVDDQCLDDDEDLNYELLYCSRAFAVTRDDRSCCVVLHRWQLSIGVLRMDVRWLFQRIQSPCGSVVIWCAGPFEIEKHYRR